MTIETHHLQEILPDNERQYLNVLEAVISSIDENASLMVNRGLREIYFRISPSEPIYSQLLLEDVLKMHKLMKIKLNLSKSIRLSSNISYNIEL